MRESETCSPMPDLLHGGIVHEPLERPEARDAVEQVLPRRHGILQVRQRADHRAGLVVRRRVLDERQDPGVLTLRVDALPPDDLPDLVLENAHRIHVSLLCPIRRHPQRRTRLDQEDTPFRRRVWSRTP